MRHSQTPLQLLCSHGDFRAELILQFTNPLASVNIEILEFLLDRCIQTFEPLKKHAFTVSFAIRHLWEKFDNSQAMLMLLAEWIWRQAAAQGDKVEFRGPVWRSSGLFSAR